MAPAALWDARPGVPRRACCAAAARRAAPAPGRRFRPSLFRAVPALSICGHEARPCKYCPVRGGEGRRTRLIGGCCSGSLCGAGRWPWCVCGTLRYSTSQFCAVQCSTVWHRMYSTTRCTVRCVYSLSAAAPCAVAVLRALRRVPAGRARVGTPRGAAGLARGPARPAGRLGAAPPGAPRGAPGQGGRHQGRSPFLRRMPPAAPERPLPAQRPLCSLVIGNFKPSKSPLCPYIAYN